jgi:hypothetical protein
MNYLRDGVKTQLEDQFVVSILDDLTNQDQGNNVRQCIAEQGNALDWNYLIRHLSAEGVASLFFHYIEQFHLQDLLPAGICDALSREYHATLRRNMIACTVLKPVFDKFNEQKIHFIVLKGIVLAELVYPGFAMRSMSDADILVRKDDVFLVDAHLTALGYISRDSSVEQALDNPVGYLASLDYQKSDGSLPNLHIHWHPVNTSVPAYMFAGQVDPDRLWEMAVHTEVANAKARILCPEHQVIYLCEHALRINHSFDRLILIYDIFYVIRTLKYEIKWDFLVEEARRFNLSKLVFLSLTVVKHYTSLIISEEIMRRLYPADLTFGEKYFLNLQLRNRRFRGSSILIYLAMNEGFIKKGRFLFRTFFPPRHILLQRQYAKNAQFGPSYYVLRFWEVVSYLFRICWRQQCKS